jgi:hypothetical protein
MTSKPPTAPAAGTSRARLGSIIKAARDIMRKDAGLNGDLDRLPLLSWLLFLRAFDAKEQERMIIEGDDFRPALSPSYQWRTWADDERLTGEELLKLVNERLLPYLAALKSDTPGGRLRGVLHAPPGHPLHGRAELPAAWRVDPGPGLRHRRLPRRGPHRADRR